MKWLILSLVSVFTFDTLTSHSRADELILVKTSLYKLNSEVSDTATQSELAALAATVEGKINQLHFETAAVTRSGKWFTSKKTKSINYPTQYSETQLIRSKSDDQVYSIEATSETEHANTLLIPGHPTEFTKKELGTTVKLKPTKQSDGTIRIEGSVTEVTLLDVPAANETPIITSRKNADSTRKKVIGQDEQKAPLFSTAKTTFSNRIPGDGTPYFSVINVKRSCLDSPVEGSPDLMKSRGTRTIKTGRALGGQNGDSPGVTIYPASPDEEIPFIVRVSAEPIKQLSKASPGKGGKVLLNVYFIESDKEITIPNPVMQKDSYELLIRTLNQEKGVDFLTAPQVMAPSGQSSKIEVGREFIFPFAYDAPEYDLEKANNEEGFPVTPATPTEFETTELGIEMNLAATIQPNGDIAIKAKTRLDKFDGFINYSNPIIETKINALGKPIPITISENQILAPLFSIREHENDIVIPNGSSCVICDLSDTQEVIVEDSGPLGLNKKVSRHDNRRQVIAIIKALRME